MDRELVHYYVEYLKNLFDRFDSNGKRGGQPGNDNASKNHIPKEKIDIKLNGLRKRFIGKTTSDGRIIKDVDAHLAIRMIDRDIFEDSIKNAIFFGKRVPGNRKGTCIYKLNGVEVVFDEKENKIKSAIYKKKGGR